jgi:hypothetical protein
MFDNHASSGQYFAGCLSRQNIKLAHNKLVESTAKITVDKGTFQSTTYLWNLDINTDFQ